MRLVSSIVIVIVATGFLAVGAPDSWAGDYHHRFIRNYPPGYHGMWYNAERFYDTAEPGQKGSESFRWDRYMSKVTELHFPFLPIPFAWDYGTSRKFNLPDYNRNDWP